MLTKGDDVYIGDARVLDILEFGRIIHAEMSAIVDAARTGRTVAGANIYCTTFPCHMCAKHIVASGIEKVVFLEPYPKSHAIRNHGDSISLDEQDREKVWFKPFIGISPYRFEQLFEKGGRTNPEGKSKDWHEERPVPKMAISTTRPYVETEKFLESGLFSIISSLRENPAR